MTDLSRDPAFRALGTEEPGKGGYILRDTPVVARRMLSRLFWDLNTLESFERTLTEDERKLLGKARDNISRVSSRLHVDQVNAQRAVIDAIGPQA